MAKKTSRLNNLLPRVQPFPMELIAKELERLRNDGPLCAGAHDLGTVKTPEEMARDVPTGGRWKEFTRETAARKSLVTLVSSGPQQCPPHLETSMVLGEGIARLRDFVLAGDQQAMEQLGFLLAQAVADLAEVAQRQPEVVRKWSRRRSTVPVNAGLGLAHRKVLKEELEEVFQVGTDSPFRLIQSRKKGADFRNPRNAFAGYLCEHLSRYRGPAIHRKSVPHWAALASQLPELSTQSVPAWRDAAWECVMDATSGQPERHPVIKSHH